MNTRQQNGYSLIELMVSMTIGLILIGGALYVYDEARATLNINNTMARMQENARWAFDIIEPDLRLAGYWGRHTAGNTITGSATSTNPIASPNDCGANWPIDTATSLRASNNVNPNLNCIGDGNWLAGTDTLEIRHASGQVVNPLVAGRIYVRTHESGRGSLFIGTTEPLIANGQNNALMAHVYYVRPFTYPTDADEPPSPPSLRRQGLTVSANAPAMVDQEVISGIEDMQIQFGIDNNNDNSVDRYVNPDNAVLNTNPKILAARVWLRVRADTPELGFNDTRTYTYADTSFTPAATDAFRRILVSRTIFLRNESINEGGLGL